MNACPVQAIYEDEAIGTKVIDTKKCIGCRTCVVACPFGGAQFDLQLRTAAKCDLCRDKEEPQCVKLCPKGVLKFADVTALGSTKRGNFVRSQMARAGDPSYGKSCE